MANRHSLAPARTALSARVGCEESRGSLLIPRCRGRKQREGGCAVGFVVEHQRDS